MVKALKPGTQLGMYRVERKLGAGGAGTVYLAHRDSDGVPVAVKILHPALVSDTRAIDRFLKEVQLGRTIRHPNVVATLDAGSVLRGQELLTFLVMEYMEGRTLRDLLRELGNVPEDLCRHVGREVAQGLSAIHDAGAVHRDLKPENILISTDDRILIADLGIALIRGPWAGGDETRGFVGSPRYAAPEQVGGDPKAVDRRADLFALGLILFELATGRHLLMDDGVEDAIRNLSPFFTTIVANLTREDPVERCPSAPALLSLLEGDRDGVSPGPHARSTIPATSFLGREEELRTLCDLADRAVRKEGEVVLIEGDAGIGKTRLLEELEGQLATQGGHIRILRAGHDSLAPRNSAGAIGKILVALYGAAGLRSGLSSLLESTPDLVDPIADLIIGRAAHPEAAAPDPDAASTGILEVIRGLAAEGPTILAIDDLQSAPDLIRRVVAQCAAALAGSPILLIGVVRTGELGGSLASLVSSEEVTRITLRGLRVDEIVGLMTELLGSREAAEGLGLGDIRASGGNPLRLIQMARSLMDRNADGVAPRSSREIPSLDTLVSRRFSTLDPDEQEILSVAAACGTTFDPFLVAEALGRTGLSVIIALARLEKTTGLVCSTAGRHRFEHEKVRDAVYGSLSPELRGLYHLSIAQSLASDHPRDSAEAVLLCHHYFRSPKPELGHPHLTTALTHLEWACLGQDAVDLAERALKVPGVLSGEERLDVLLTLAAHLKTLGQRASAEEVIQQAEEIASNLGECRMGIRVATAKGSLKFAMSRLPEAIELLECAAAEARAAGHSDLEMRALGEVGVPLTRSGRLAEARGAHLRQLEIAQDLGNRVQEAQALGGLSMVLAELNDMPVAREHGERHLELARELGERRMEANAHLALGNLTFALGEREAAREHYQKSLALYLRVGHRTGALTATGNLGMFLFHEGRYEEAREQKMHQLSLARELGDLYCEAKACDTLGCIESAQGRLPQAFGFWERQLSIALLTGEVRSEIASRCYLGMARTMFGDYERATNELEKALHLSRENGYPNWIAYALILSAGCAEGRERFEDAEEFFREAIQLLRSGMGGYVLARVLTSFGAMMRELGRVEEARPLLLEGVELAEGGPDGGSIVVGLAQAALLPGGDAEKAREALVVWEAKLDWTVVIQANFLLWRATDDRRHLEAAHRRLRSVLAELPEDQRQQTIDSVQLHRDIVTAFADC